MAALRQKGFLLTLTFFVLPAGGFGQAWVPDRGEGLLSLTYQNITFGGHFDSSGNKLPVASAHTQNAGMELDYGLSKKLALTLSIPYIAPKYTGTTPSISEARALFNQLQQQTGGTYKHPFLDDGSYHGTFQDFRFSVRYNVASRPFLLTPFVSLGVPSHDYAYVGESAPGRNFKELTLGANVGRRLDPFLPRAYVQAQISYAISQKALDVSTNHTNVALEGGYFLTRRLSVQGLGFYQHTYGGLHFPQDLTTPLLTLTHERLLKANYWHLGGAASFAISPSVSIYGGVVTFLSGSDTHYGSGVSVGMSWRFRGRRTPANVPASAGLLAPSIPLPSFAAGVPVGAL